MNLKQRINAFSELGKRLTAHDSNEVDELLERVNNQNAWFTKANSKLALEGIAKFLIQSNLEKWTSSYELNPKHAKKIGVVMAGNIPLVGFHDFLSILISGHKVLAKLSSQDSILIKWLTEILITIDPEFSELISFQERLNDAEAMIATGSDNTARYFEYYFRNVPNIIRRNRSSCGIILGKESNEELKTLGLDVFTYFGLGCRNVSKLYIPEGYRLSTLLDTWDSYQPVIQHHKYCNNYDYQKSILLVNSVPHLDNGFVLLTENEALVSPISTVYYETYHDQTDLHKKIMNQNSKLQCIVSANAWFTGSTAFGKAQFPEVWDYADHVDTLKFLEFR